MNILAIIPARGGSKGVKNKNIIDLNGEPLIHYTIKEAQKVKELTRIVVSTESNLIKSVCDKLGDFIPFLRPEELAQDASRTIDVVEHLIGTLKNDYNENYDYICLLQPTSPLRIANDIKEKLFAYDANIVIMGHSHYPFVWQQEDKIVMNPGSVGQQRDRILGACWALWNSETHEVNLRREAYDVSPVQKQTEQFDPDKAYLKTVLTRTKDDA